MRRALALALPAFVAACLVLAAGWARAQELLPVPPLSGRVIDQTGTLSAAQREAMSGKLAAVEAQRGSQIVVLIVASTLPEDIAPFAQRVGEAWKIGRRDVGDGLLIVVAKNDRRIRIEVAKALEGAVPDLAASRIIRETVTPAFRAGDFAGGLNAAIDQLSALIGGEGLPEPKARDSQRGGGLLGGFGLEDLAIFLFVIVPIVAAIMRGIFGRKLGALATGGLVGGIGWWITASLLVAAGAGLVALLIAGLGIASPLSRRGGGPVIWGGGGGGWGGGGGGGGFGSGGGGDFGGGGASGDW